MADIQPVETTAPQEGTTHFGIEGLKNPTPSWATWVFRSEFIFNKVIGIWLGSTHFISNLQNMQELVLIISIIDTATWLAARFVGVKKSDIESQLN